MGNEKLQRVSDSRTDTVGLEGLFDDTVSHDTADTQPQRIIEVSIAEAAARLGISERTIWRRIDRGELKSKSKGNKRVVKLPVYEPVSEIDSDGHTTLADTPPKVNAVVDLQSLLRDLQSANYRIGYLESELRNHQEQVKLLPDLQGKAAQAAALEAKTQQLELELADIKSHWWYRIWCWLLRR